jgi:hypothetical protein
MLVIVVAMLGTAEEAELRLPLLPAGHMVDSESILQFSAEEFF